jgi:FAD synthetase
MKTRILCAGTFDRLHTGHINYFRYARKLSLNPHLIVIVARDKTSKKIKGKQTINNELKRLSRIKSIEEVDKAVLGFENGKIIERIVSLKPDIIALGYDQWAKESWLIKQLKDKGLQIKVLRMPEFERNYF